MNVPANFHVVIVGAGVSGICMAKKLKDLGIRFVLLLSQLLSRLQSDFLVQVYHSGERKWNWRHVD